MLPALDLTPLALSRTLTVRLVSVLVHADGRQLILHRRAISGGIGVRVAQHAAIFGMDDIELHALGQADIGGNKAKTVSFVAARGLDVSDPGRGPDAPAVSKLSVMTGLH